MIVKRPPITGSKARGLVTCAQIDVLYAIGQVQGDVVNARLVHPLVQGVSEQHYKTTIAKMQYLLRLGLISSPFARISSYTPLTITTRGHELLATHSPYE